MWSGRRKRRALSWSRRRSEGACGKDVSANGASSIHTIYDDTQEGHFLARRTSLLPHFRLHHPATPVFHARLELRLVTRQGGPQGKPHARALRVSNLSQPILRDSERHSPRIVRSLTVLHRQFTSLMRIPCVFRLFHIDLPRL